MRADEARAAREKHPARGWLPGVRHGPTRNLATESDPDYAATRTRVLLMAGAASYCA